MHFQSHFSDLADISTVHSTGNDVATCLSNVQNKQNAMHTLCCPWHHDERVGAKYWCEISNRREYTRWLGDELNINNLDDWYKITLSRIYEKPGAHSFLEFYGKSLQAALLEIYPEHQWQPWLFECVPHGFWHDARNRRNYVEWVAQELKIDDASCRESWYSVKVSDVQSKGGAGLLQQQYGGSLQKLLCDVFPDTDWKPWLFEQVPSNFWSRTENVRTFLLWLAEQLNVTHMVDWHKVSLQQMSLLGGTALLRKHGSIFAILSKFLPDCDLLDPDERRIISGKQQQHLFRSLQHLFPHQECLLNCTPSFSKNIEVDILIPDISLAFEYQGEQHYHQTVLVSASLEARKCKDISKQSV